MIKIPKGLESLFDDMTHKHKSYFDRIDNATFIDINEYTIDDDVAIKIDSAVSMPINNLCSMLCNLVVMGLCTKEDIYGYIGSRFPMIAGNLAMFLENYEKTKNSMNDGDEYFDDGEERYKI